MSYCADFWDTLAAFHAEIEDTNFDLASVRQLLPEIVSPVLVIGAGQGLIVEELRKHGHECDGVDLSSEMIRQAMRRRNLAITRADARALPFATAAFATIIYATGVVDFTRDEAGIAAMLAEGQRVLKPSGKRFIAFYTASAAQEAFLRRVGLIDGNALMFRQSLEIHLMNPFQVVGWLAKRAGIGRVRLALALLRVVVSSTRYERRATSRMQRVFRKMKDPRALIRAAPETMPYRNEAEIENLFRRLDIPIQQHRSLGGCRVVRI